MKSNNHKKLILILGIILIALLIVVFSIYCYFSLIFPKGNYEKNEKAVNNNYNNSHLSDGNLAINGDTLYFNYNGEDSIFFYGTYKIDRVNSSRIYWEGPSFSPGNGLYSMQTFKNNILLKDYYTDERVVDNQGYSTVFDGKIYCFNKDTNNIELYSELDGSNKNKYIWYEVINDKIYAFSKNSIYESNDGKNINKVFDNLSDVAGIGDANKSSYYITGESLCYISKDGCIKEFDFKKQRLIFSEKLSESEIKFDEDDSYLFTVVKCNDRIILICELDEDDKTVVYDVTSDFKRIYNEDISDSGIIYKNLYKNYLFLSSEKSGLILIDVNTGIARKLLNQGVKDVYILDNKWIYYVNKNGGLNRITYDKSIENVFG